MKRYIYKDIIMVGSAGLWGALLLAGKEPEKIKTRFPGHILRDMKDIENREKATRQSVSDAVCKCVDGAEITFAGEVGERGVTAALWDMGEAMSSGFRVYADKIPVSPVSVEICELFGADPLKISSEGCYLLCTPKGNELCGSLLRQNISPAIIGHTEETKAKVLVMGEIIRYIDKPRKARDF